jgi:hypothetical protein
MYLYRIYTQFGNTEINAIESTIRHAAGSGSSKQRIFFSLSLSLSLLSLLLHFVPSDVEGQFYSK